MVLLQTSDVLLLLTIVLVRLVVLPEEVRFDDFIGHLVFLTKDSLDV